MPGKRLYFDKREFVQYNYIDVLINLIRNVTNRKSTVIYVPSISHKHNFDVL